MDNVKILQGFEISCKDFYISESCCDEFEIDTIGGGNFYQEERYGHYFKIGTGEDGKNVYRQQNGDNYMYYLNAGYWMIGKEIGKDSGGVLNRGNSFCPEDATSVWEYWNDWQEVLKIRFK